MNALLLVENRHDPQPIIERHAAFLPTWEHELRNPPIRNLRDYNTYMTSDKIWAELYDYDRVLVIQHDSRILRDGIDEFMIWDYVGAPWKFQYHGGNGGFSLRNPKKMYEITAHYSYHPSQGYEDVWFCNIMQRGNYKLAPRSICEKFSCETIFKLGTFGCHAIESYLTPDEVNKIYNQYKS